MTKLEYEPSQKILLKDHPDFDERWVQNVIAEDPSRLGLGDLVLKDRERPQVRGRLDLLLQHPDLTQRYEVELQLGSSDPDHIIRTLEYWDIERKRFPRYDHTAVLIAEDITSRFLNVISLFNGTIPLVAIQMNALKVDNKITLAFTKVLDQIQLGLDEEDETQEPADREFWELKRGTKETVRMADKVLEIIHTFDPDVELNYTRAYIGLYRDGRPNNYVSFGPQKKAMLLRLKLPQSEVTEQALNEAGMDVMDYNPRWRQYRIRLNKEDIEQHKDLLADLMKQAYEDFNG